MFKGLASDLFWSRRKDWFSFFNNVSDGDLQRRGDLAHAVWDRRWDQIHIAGRHGLVGLALDVEFRLA